MKNVVKVFANDKLGWWYGKIFDHNCNFVQVIVGYVTVGQLLQHAAIVYGCTHFTRNTQKGYTSKIPKSIIENGRWK